MVELKSRFDQSFEHLLNELNTLNLSVVNNAIGDNPTKEEKAKIKEYFSCLQLEMSGKIKNLVAFQEILNSRCSKILKMTEFAVFSDSSQGKTTSKDYSCECVDGASD